ncbi:MAG: sulfotransferase, partial [Deltaproteobacteria bacterium]
QKAEITQLRNHLEVKLPDYMIPSAFVTLDEMPLSPNGKVDRRALPVPSMERPDLEQPYVAPRNKLEHYLEGIWREIIKLDRVGIHDRFFELGGSSLQAARFINRLQQELGENIYIVSIFESPTIAEYAAFLQRDYARSVSIKLGLEEVPVPEKQPVPKVAADGEKIDVEMIALMHECIPTLSWDDKESDEPKNPPALFIISPPRSGTTLLRVMLAGHPDLFAASELQLLGFNTLQERKIAFVGKYSLWLEGTIRTIMEIKGCDAEEATRIMEEYQSSNYTTKQFYRVLQDWIGDKILVDKSPAYVSDLKALEKAERDFRDPLYIHLCRHPYPMVRSFESYHMEQVLFLKSQPFSPLQLGELLWLISHQNALQFLRQVPPHRQYHMRFEDLVSQPQKVMEELCKTFQLQFHSDLVRPYDKVEKKMTDGIHRESKPMGDTKFLEYGKINPKVAETWKGVMTDNFLSDATWELASILGYEKPGSETLDHEIQPTARKRTARSRRELLEQSRQRRQRIRK